MMTPEKAKNIYWGASPLPIGSKSLGEYVDDHRRGCLILLSSGVKVVGMAGIIQTIPQGSGGSRAGAGRKPASPHLKKITKGIRLSSWVWDWLDKQDEPRGTMLEAALLEKHNLKPPANHAKINQQEEIKMKALSAIAKSLRKKMTEEEIVAAIKNREIKDIEKYGYTQQQNYPNGVFVFSDEEDGGIMFGTRE